MPIISTIGRKSPKMRLLIGSIYLLLGLGTVTMIYPFLLMLAGSTKSNVDTPEAEVIPSYLSSDTGLYRKFAESFFNESPASLIQAWGTDQRSFRHLELPSSVTPRFADVWLEFLKETPHPKQSWCLSGMRVVGSRMVLPENLRRFRKIMIERFNGDMDELNRKMGTRFINWTNFNVPITVFDTRRKASIPGPFEEAYFAFAVTRPLEERYYFSATRFYVDTYLKSQYTTIDNYNKKHGTDFTTWEQVILPRTSPGTGVPREDWEYFVRNILNTFWIRLNKREQENYQAYLKAKYRTIEGLNRTYESANTSFAQVVFETAQPKTMVAAADWRTYLRGWKDPDTLELHQAELESIYLDTIEFKFIDYLKKRYADIGLLNDKFKTSFADWPGVMLPQQDGHYKYFQDHKVDLRWEFTKRNFIPVFDTILIRGRAVWNTVVYCTLAIISALVVNPLAAYGLSRYKPPAAYKVLLFLMLTMAFPPMVTQIPNFLLLREFNLLNTFWALILPGLANGYSIFLLKGFFDSLPKELYEAAEMDGASEFRIFWQITMSLSKPILAVIALGAFTSAYSNFMMALLICQDSRMWTLMPWLYQLQMWSCQGVVCSSLIVAAIPTFIVFALCQNVIMRGIVVPVEK